MSTFCETTDLLVFSHLRWDFVFHRPQHLMSRFAKYRRVFYFEEPIYGMTDQPRLHMRETTEGVHVYIPYLPNSTKSEDTEAALRHLVDELIFDENIQNYACWYYSPMAGTFTDHLKPNVTIFDWMEEFLPMTDYELELANRANLIFTESRMIFEEKKQIFSNLHHFPSSIDYAHFSQGRMQLVEPDDQIHIPHPRIGFTGVLDERIDVDLINFIADQHPEWQLVLIGPMVDLQAEKLLKRASIHYLGRKDYHALPIYMAGWDCAFVPFVLSTTTTYINPSKIPEFLAAGKPVVATALPSVTANFANTKLVDIVESREHFVKAIEKAMQSRQDPAWLEQADTYLAQTSWDSIFKKMATLESDVLRFENHTSLQSTDEFQSL